MPEVITVAASNMEDELANFSDYGKCIDIVAPGEKILTISNDRNFDGYLKDGKSSFA